MKTLFRCLLFGVGVFNLVAVAMAADGVDDKRLLSAHTDNSNWLTYGHGYSNQRYSELDDINRDNVKRLVPRWIYQTGIPGTFQTNPLIADGIMYLSTPYNHVVALDAVTGKMKWRYEHKLTTEELCCGPTNRGVAMGYGKIYMITVDARLIALDMNTGAVLWDVPVADPSTGARESLDFLAEADTLKTWKVIGWTGFSGNMAPLVFDGQVIIGVTGAGYGLTLRATTEGDPHAVVGIAGEDQGLRAFVSAYDAGSGKLRWRWYSTPTQGWEGKFSGQTAAGDSLERDLKAEKAALPKYVDAWKRGGGSVWTHPALDPAAGLLYVGTGNPAPQMDDSTRPGDNLYTSSLVALDARTGQLKWYFQEVPHDVWNYDVASPPILIDTMHNGRLTPAVAQAGKTGWLYVLNRLTGKLLSRSEPFVPQHNIFRRPTRDGIVISPGLVGGNDWSPAAYNPQTGWIYVAAVHMPTKYTVHDVPPEKRKPGLSDIYVTATSAEESGTGRLSAIDPASGKIQWQVHTDKPLVGGVATSAGGLVFVGESNGQFTARDARDGRLLWQFNTGAGVNAPPVIYRAGGKQFVVVAAGGHEKFQFPLGDAVIAFGLPDD